VIEVAAPVARLDDAALMCSVQAGDQAAFSTLYDRLKTRAHGVALGIARDRSQAEDIVQEAFLAVWRNRATYVPHRGSPAAWVLGVVRNRAIDSLRHDARDAKHRAGEQHIDQHAHPSSEDLQHATIERDEAARLRGLLAQIPAEQREIIVLAYFGELSGSEIAAQLDLPLGTVKGRMRLGLKKLAVSDPAPGDRAPR
jgi:RNA polymerase sigma-70 factor (ECF subfamily)